MLAILNPTASTTPTPEVFASGEFTLDLFWHLAVVTLVKLQTICDYLE